ncbi:ArsR/SmtB family transcription factor [Cohnella kolymensis]
MSLIGEQTRAIMLDTLLGGQSLPAGELAYIAGVTPQTASSHLSKLIDANVLLVETNGRHRYYRLASPEVAQLMELIAAVTPPVRVRSLRESEQMKKVRHARTCYDHLAGRLGVDLTKSMLDNGLIEVESPTDFSLTSQGHDHFRQFGIDFSVIKLGRRVFARRCLDWSERYHHVGGLLGATLTSALFERRWIERVEGLRAVKVTDVGRSGFREFFGLDVKEIIKA